MASTQAALPANKPAKPVVPHDSSSASSNGYATAAAKAASTTTTTATSYSTLSASTSAAAAAAAAATAAEASPSGKPAALKRTQEEQPRPASPGGRTPRPPKRASLKDFTLSLAAVLNDPTRPREPDLFTRDWGDTFVPNTMPPLPAEMRNVKKEEFADYLAAAAEVSECVCVCA